MGIAETCSIPMMTSLATIEEILPSTSFFMSILSGTTSAT